MGRRTGRLFVGFTLSLISFIAYSSQIFVVWPWYGRELSVELITLLLPFNVLVGMLLWNYWLCVLTDPGQVPKGWKPDTHDGEGYEVKKLTRGPRYCRSCESYKPPRAHHCRQCNRCVLRMDHHCPWVNNCVGHFNYGHFIRFLFYVDVACSYHAAMMTTRVLHTTSSWYWDEPDMTQMIFIILNFATCIPVLLAVGGFSLYHFWMLFGNTTTIEGWEKDKVATLVRRGKIQEIKFPYNLGWKRNMESVLGKRSLYWCWPTVPPGSGLKYPLAAGQDSHDEESWPPKEPNTYRYPDADPNHVFKLPDNPWTYENGTFNPDLHASNPERRQSSQMRKRNAKQQQPSSSKSKKRDKNIPSVPPYHPDYMEPGAEEDETYSDSPPPSLPNTSSEDEYDEEPGERRFIRRGSEGYEVRSIDREEMLRRFIEGRVHEPGRYNVYQPEPASGPESEEDEDVPLVARVGNLQTVPATS